MRTRRSPHNQQVLWNDLFGKRPAKSKADPIAVAQRILADPFASPRMCRQAERDIAHGQQKARVMAALRRDA